MDSPTPVHEKRELCNEPLRVTKRGRGRTSTSLYWSYVGRLLPTCTSVSQAVGMNFDVVFDVGNLLAVV